MNDEEADLLAAVKDRTWFYEFDLPDGTQTKSDLWPDVLPIHTSRRDRLTEVIRDYVPDAQHLTALDFASHEGYYSVQLGKHFSRVHGLEIRPESIAAARLITRVLRVHNVTYSEADLQSMQCDEALRADFVLVYGLLYHVENPIHTLRLACELSRKHILIETQVFPYDIGGTIEDGNYQWQRKVNGVFSLSADYAHKREGGSTDLALVPSLNALTFLLRAFGFETVQVLASPPGDYEQFRRGSRVIVYGAKPSA